MSWSSHWHCSEARLERVSQGGEGLKVDLVAEEDVGVLAESLAGQQRGQLVQSRGDGLACQEKVFGEVKYVKKKLFYWKKFLNRRLCLNFIIEIRLRVY